MHLNLIDLAAADAVPTTEAELAWTRRRAVLRDRETGYSHEHRTRPQMLGVAMADSPVGAAVWLLEKFGMWADLARREDSSPDLWSVFNEELLLTNIMLYVATRSFVTSTWIYQGEQQEGSFQFAPGERVTMPTGACRISRPRVSPAATVIRGKDLPNRPLDGDAGRGHFAAPEQPERFLADLRAFIAAMC